MVRSASPSSARPVYLRLRDLIAAEIMDGAFAEGEMLPSEGELRLSDGEIVTRRGRVWGARELSDGEIDV